MKSEEGEEEGEVVVELELVSLLAAGGRSKSLELKKDKIAFSSSETVIRLCLGRLRDRKRRRVLVEEGREGGVPDVELEGLGLLALGEAAEIVEMR